MRDCTLSHQKIVLCRIKRIHVSRLPLDGIMNYQGVFTVTLT